MFLSRLRLNEVGMGLVSSLFSKLVVANDRRCSYHEPPHPTRFDGKVSIFHSTHLAGTDSRLVIPIPRIYLSPEHLAKSIPSLSNRQYVVDKSRKSPHQLRAERELFWYRDALLDKLHCTWLEPGSNRSGHLNLRGQGLRPALLEVLKREESGIVLDIPGRIKTAEFTELSTRIVNHLGESPFFSSP